ncbi:MAG: GNAT family N-acetyltransferase [Sphaerochaetaceae bacterium]|nr:GNAT family N-acetyltransferase [Sphaerochaetaceae bacterium]
MNTGPTETVFPTNRSVGSRIMSIARRLHLPPWLFDHSRTYLMEVPVLPSAVHDYTVRPAALNDLPLLAVCREMEDVDKGVSLFTERINSGASCYLVFDKEENLLGYAWVTETQNLFEDDDRIAVSCSADEAYIFDTFLHPGSRGKGLYRILISHLQHDLAVKNKKRFYVLVDHMNAVSIKAHQKLGATTLELISYTCIAGICHYTMKTPEKRRGYLRRFRSSRPCDSLSLHPQNPRRFELAVTRINAESDWNRVKERLEECEKSDSDTNTPFSGPSVVQVWWESDIKDKEDLFLLEMIDTERSQTAAYGFFRLYEDRNRFAHPKKLSLFDDVYFMHTTMFTRCGNLQSHDVMRFLTSRHCMKVIQKETGADVMVFHRLSPQQLPTLSRGRLTRWDVKFEADYPVLEGSATGTPLQSDIGEHTLRDLKKQAKRLKNRFTTERVTDRFELGLMNEQDRENVLQRFFTIFTSSWQHQWMEESDCVDNELYEKKLREYTRRWAADGSAVIYITSVKEIDMSYLFTLQKGQYCWCLLIGYDPQYKTYSPGKAVLIDMLADTWDNGIREYYLGGNVVGWKNEWFTRCPPLHTMELWLTSDKAFIHRMKLFVRKSH